MRYLTEITSDCKRTITTKETDELRIYYDVTARYKNYEMLGDIEYGYTDYCNVLVSNEDNTYRVHHTQVFYKNYDDPYIIISKIKIPLSKFERI